MPNYNQAAGQLLRKFRQDRQLTLQDAADRLNISTPMLSRKERGEASIGREDIRCAIQGYALSPWEAQELWMTAGFLPDPPLVPPFDFHLHEIVQVPLSNVTFPAFVADALGYVLAWNQGIEGIWAPSQVDATPLHLLDDIFSERLRARLGERWDQYAARMLRIFYHRTLRLANTPDYQALLDQLADRHGERFIGKWNDTLWSPAQNDPPPTPTIDNVLVRYESPLGWIEYLVVHAVFQLPQSYDLVLYVPHGADDRARYDRYLNRLGGNRLFFSRPPDDPRPKTNRPDDPGGER